MIDCGRDSSRSLRRARRAQGIGRGFKAGKEEIVGLLTALDRFVRADDAKANAQVLLPEHDVPLATAIRAAM